MPVSLTVDIFSPSTPVTPSRGSPTPFSAKAKVSRVPKHPVDSSLRRAGSARSRR